MHVLFDLIYINIPGVWKTESEKIFFIIEPILKAIPNRRYKKSECDPNFNHNHFKRMQQIASKHNYLSHEQYPLGQFLIKYNQLGDPTLKVFRSAHRR